MIRREAYSEVQARLEEFSSVALIGPRQAGKTTLARMVASQRESARYLDLESPADRRRLDDPEAWFRQNGDHLVVLDEIQRMPELFTVLRGEIDRRRQLAGRGGRFLILGSASMDLLRQSSESLAGRISFVELGPLNLTEVLEELPDALETQTDRLWARGGFPDSFLARSDRSSLQWRRDFIVTYLERDLPQFGFQVSSEQMHLFWRMLAVDQGELFNAERFSRSLGVSGHTVARYLSILEKLLLVRRLEPWSVNRGKRLVKSPRIYIRDCGLLHALLELGDTDAVRGHPVAGKSWEGLVIEQLIGAAGAAVRPHFYRTGAGAEADLVLEFAPDKVWAIEIKLSSAPTLERGFHNAADDLKAERRILVHRGQEAFPMRGAVEAMPLREAIAAVRREVEHGY